MTEKHIFISSGEVSSDYQAAWIVQRMKKDNPNIRWSGVGSTRMRQAGVKLLYEMAPFSSVGIFEALSVIPRLMLRMLWMCVFIWRESVNLVLLMDNQGFNLPFARALALFHVRVVYYFPPHVSIWAGWNAKKVARLVDVIICPFYEDYVLYCQQLSAESYYVGHPLVEQLESDLNRPSMLRWTKKRVNLFRIGIFPGTRRHEIGYLLPVFLDAAFLIRQEYNSCFYMAIPDVHWQEVEKLIQQYPKAKTLSLKRIPSAEYNAYRQLDFAMACSGSLTLELALLNVAMVVAYRLNSWSYRLLKPWIHSPYMALPNILLQKERWPELRQHEVSAINIVRCFRRSVDESDTFASLQLRKLIYLPGTTQRVIQILNAQFGDI